MRAVSLFIAMLLFLAACSRPLPWTSRGNLNLPPEADAAYGRARDLYYKGQFAAAADHFERAFQSSAAAKKPYAMALKYEGLCYQYRGDYDKARALFRRASEFDHDTTNEIDTLNNLGWLAYLRGDLAESLDQLQNAEQLIRISGSEPRGSHSVSVQINLGIVHMAYGDYAKAMGYFEYAAGALEKKPHPMNESLLFRHLGNLQYLWGISENAMDCYERALSAAARESEQPYNPAYHAETLIDCAAFLMQSGETRRDPEEILQQALAEGRKLDTPRITTRAFSALGDLARVRGNPRQALDYHRQALEQANRLAFKAELQAIWVEIGYDQLVLREFRAAGDAFEQALAQITGVRRREIEIRIHAGLAQSAARLGDLDAALQHSREAVRLVESTNLRSLSEVSRSAYRSQQHGAYATLVDLLAGQGKTVEAFQAAERGRSRTLQEVAAESALAVKAPMDSKERFLLARISRLEARLQVVPDAAQEGAVVRELALARAALDQFAGTRRMQGSATGVAIPVPLSAIQRKLQIPGNLLVEFLLSEPRSHAWIISSSSFRYVALPGQSAIEDAVRGFLSNVSGPPIGSDSLADWQEQGCELYRMLFGPEAGAVAAASRLFIVADGTLLAMPFEALPIGKSATGFEQTLAAREISYVPSATLWLQPRKNPETGERGEFLALAYAGKEGSGKYDLSRLAWGRYQEVPGAEVEARSVGEYLGAHPGRTLVGKDASEAFLVGSDLTRCRILHIAGHVYADENDPRRSGIFLGPGNGEDGYLCMDEISRIRLNADLVTLSGCRSGIGRILRAEGMFSLARAFLSAGARNVIMSLWKTDDEANLQFMKIFYQELSRGARPSKALQEVRRRFFSSNIPAYRHPYFWAAFVSLERSAPALQ